MPLYNRQASIFRITNPTALTTDGQVDVLQNSAIKDDTENYGPFNKFIVRNNGLAVVILRLDGQTTTTRAIRLNPSETALTDANEYVPFEFITIELDDTLNDVAIGDIDATFIRVIT